ncbi:MAG TPA: twin-arginine translocase TatA/TatE family subunit [Chthoniobacterales bacterium]|jgi:sec-independent protein translocase protein TatA
MISFASLTNLAGPDLLIILLIVLVLFGAKKLPELARGMGQAVKEFQKAKDEFTDELHKAGNTPATPAAPNVQPAQSTVARADTGSPAATQTHPDPNQQIPPGTQANQI